MKLNFRNNSIVIVANSHNPSVISDYFLLKTEMIKSADDLQPNAQILTPAFSNIVLKDSTSIQVDSSKLLIASSDKDKPFDLAKKYCQNLPYIKANGVGINFEYNIDDYDFDKWFYLGKSNYKDSSVKSINISFTADKNTTATVIASYINPSTASLLFNFHNNYKDIPLIEINHEFSSLRKKYERIINEFIESTFQNIT